MSANVADLMKAVALALAVGSLIYQIWRCKTKSMSSSDILPPPSLISAWLSRYTHDQMIKFRDELNELIKPKCAQTGCPGGTEDCYTVDEVLPKSVNIYVGGYEHTLLLDGPIYELGKNRLMVNESEDARSLWHTIYTVEGGKALFALQDGRVTYRGCRVVFMGGKMILAYMYKDGV
jgi:hypothetical protein